MTDTRKLPSLFVDEPETETTDVTNLESVYMGFVKRLDNHTKRMDEVVERLFDETRASIFKLTDIATELSTQSAVMNERIDSLRETLRKGHACAHVEDFVTLRKSVVTIEAFHDQQDAVKNKKQDENRNRKWIVIPILLTVLIATTPFITGMTFRAYDAMHSVESHAKRITALEDLIEEKFSSRSDKTPAPSVKSMARTVETPLNAPNSGNN